MNLKLSLLFFAMITTCCLSQEVASGHIETPAPDVSEIVKITSFPNNYQLFARDKNNKAQIKIAGTIEIPVDSLFVTIYKANNFTEKIAILAQKKFKLQIELEALLHNYTIELIAKTSSGKETLIKKATHITVGDVFVVHGQSNAWAIDYDDQYNSENLTEDAHWIRTIGAMHVYNRAALLPEAENTDWFIASGKAPDMRAGQFVGDGMIGVLGMNLGIHLIASEQVPIAIINGAGGGGSISFYQKTTDKDLNTPYGRLQYRLEASGLKNDIKAFIWNQGENNAGDSVEEYQNALNELYSYFTSDYTFEKFYVIQTPPGCNSSSGHQNVREAQRQFSNQHKNVSILTRHGFSKDPTQLDGNYFLQDGCHYHAHGYEVLADWIANLARYDFYGNKTDFQAPKMVSVSLETSSSVIVEFDKEVRIQNDIQIDGVTYKATDYLFSINNTITSISSIATLKEDNQKIRIIFDGVTLGTGDKLTHILSDNYPNTKLPYQGPWIIDATTGVGACGFTKTIE